MNRILISAFSLLVLPSLVLAQSGKLRGVVTDKETGDPIFGANVIVDDTNMGSATESER